MCGIAGVVAPRAQRHEPVVAAMLAALGHRGPDGRGTRVFADCVLGATRLAVMDPAGGHQPMVRPDGATAVAFNGEIYGHRRLRAGLRYPFATDCDTEVLLALHQAHGPGFVEALPGMFAYALWDDRARRLHCGRDRFGEKPFYWLRGPDGAFAFASEVGALAATGWLDPVVDDRALAHMVAHGRVPATASIYRDVEVLPPAHHLSVTPGADPSTVRYWAPPRRRRRADPAEAAEELRAALDRSVADQLLADVPVGAFLSGGLDSSAVVASAATRHPDLHTFSFTLGGSDDETPFARLQAERSGTAHEVLSAPSIDPVTTLRRVARVHDEPFGDASAVPTLLLAERAREQVTVALTGDGADELLGGYLFWSRSFLTGSGAPLPRSLGGPGCRRRDRGRLLEAYRGFRRYVDDAGLRALGLPPEVGAPPPWRPSGTVADLLRHDLEGYLPGDILVKTDRASMAVGLELRSPFLSVEVAELCLSLPEEVLVGPAGDKLVLRRAVGDRVAPAIVARDKLGFSGPMAGWLADPGVTDLLRELASGPDAPLGRLVDLDGASPLLGGTGQATWNLLALGLWAEARPDARR